MTQVAEALDTQVSRYVRLHEELKRGAPRFGTWFVRLRAEAMERFASQGFPTIHDEAWKPTSVAALARTTFESADAAPSSELASGDPELRLGGMSLAALSPIRLFFVGGRYSPRLSARAPLADGVRVESLRQVLAEHPEWLEPHLGRYANAATNPFTDLNTAFIEDGAFVHIPDGVRVRQPIHLIFLTSAAGRSVMSHPRNLVVAGSGSQAAIVETYAGAGSYFTNAVTEVVAGDNASVEHTKLQRESTEAYHIATLQVRQERDSSFTSHSIALGGSLSRFDINVVLAAPGSECSLNGLFMGSGGQHMDHHTLIDHASPHCASRELYKGVLGGKARGVFHGKIIVRPGAQKTDAQQTNKNLLLSSDALVSSTPQLEIHADDVKCKHGSTIGQIDADALFYLRSRGIGEAAARDLLTYAFASEVVGRIGIAPLRAGLEVFLGARLPGAPRGIDRPANEFPESEPSA